MDPEESGRVQVAAPSAAAVALGATAKAMTRHYLASAHLWCAMQSAVQCRDLEVALKGGPSVHPTHRGYAISAVMSSVAFLESFVNELYQDAADDAPGRVESLDGHCRSLMREYWATAERTSVLTKYQIALLFAGAPPMIRGAAPLQDAALLIAFRNALVHFRPAWHDDEEPDNLEKRLSGRFAKSELLSENDGSPWPIWALGAGGAAWSVATARALSDDWSNRMGLTPAYQTDVDSFHALRQAASLESGS